MPVTSNAAPLTAAERVSYHEATTMFEYAKATFKRWQSKYMGEKPTENMLNVAAKFFKGKPGKNALCLAMALRPEGVTSAQMVVAVGDPKHNARRDLVKGAHYFRYVDFDGAALSEPVKNTVGHMYYRVELTGKGQAHLDKVAAREVMAVVKATEKAAKANGKGKGDLATPVAAKPEKPASEPAKGVQGPMLTADQVHEAVAAAHQA